MEAPIKAIAKEMGQDTGIPLQALHASFLLLELALAA